MSGISPSPTLTTIEPSVPTSMIPIPEPSLLPIATPTPQITALPQPTVVSVPQSLIVSPPPGWISQPTEDPSEIGYYQLVNQQNIVIAEYLINLESLSSPLNPKGYLGYLQETYLKPPTFNGYIPQQTIDTNFLGLQALRHDFLFTIDNLQLKAMAILIVLGNNAYSFLFYCTPNDFPSLEATFIQALSTVSVQGSTGSQPIPSTTSLPPVDTLTSPTPQQSLLGTGIRIHPILLMFLCLQPLQKQDIQSGVATPAQITVKFI